MTKNSESAPTTYEFKAELKQLLNIIVHSLYTQPEIFLRELISNASDALNKVRFMQVTSQPVLDSDAELKITIAVDEKRKWFTIEDTGIGMTHDELVQNIGTVASSGTLKFMEELQKNGKVPDNDLIGKFGVGFYSVFIVTDEVIVETRHANLESKGYRWKSDGKGTFTIEEIDRKERGTKITFTLKDEYKEFAEEYRIKSIIQKYSNFVNFPIQIGKEKVNKLDALWRRSKDDIKEEELVEFYKFIASDWEPPLGHLQVSIEGAVNFKALLFIGTRKPENFLTDIREKTLHLYANRVFIQDDAIDLLPEYLRFVKGVVDTEDLPLNISHQVTQQSPAMEKIRNVLTSRILQMLDEWAKNDQGKYEKFFKTFGMYFKAGVGMDFTNKEKIVKLLRFESTTQPKGELVSLDEYVARMRPEQKEIYYILGENREIVDKNPNLEYFRKHDIEVLFMIDPMDVFILPQLDEFDKKKIKSIDKADIDLKEKPSENPEDSLAESSLNSLIAVFKETLGEKVADIVASKRLVNSPATLVLGKDSIDQQTEKMMKLMNMEVPAHKKIMEINPNHPLIRNLSRLNFGNSNDPILRNTIVHLYESAQLLDGNLADPGEYLRRMNELLVQATK